MRHWCREGGKVNQKALDDHRRIGICKNGMSETQETTTNDETKIRAGNFSENEKWSK